MGLFDFARDMGRKLFDTDAEAADNIKEHLNIRAVKWIDEVLALALESTPEPLSDEEYLAGSVGGAVDGEKDENNRINTH